MATSDIAEDLATAYKVGEAAYNDFKKTRLESEPPTVVEFHDKLKKQNLKTFTALTKTKTVAKGKGTETVLRADRNLFARMIIIAESRNVQMQDVLKHPLGSLPASLASNNGFHRKTNKAQLGKELEKLIEPTEVISKPSAYLIDGMALVQKMKVDYLTFGEIADKILSRVLREGDSSDRVDVVFDVYRDISIKSAEKEIRGESDAITFKNLASGHKVRQFKNFSRNADTKTSLIRFVVQHWQTTSSRARLEDKELHVTCGKRCYKITADKVEEELRSEQEEADTRLLLHAQHAANEQRYRSIIVSSENTDVRVLCLAFSFSIDVPMYQRCVSQTNARYIDIGKIAHAIGQDACNALPGLHAFTGCDAVSAFAGDWQSKAPEEVTEQSRIPTCVPAGWRKLVDL